jgi:hypothetical protein
MIGIYILLSYRISILMFRTIRIWLPRQTGKYWPSVCYTLDSKFSRKYIFYLLWLLGAPTALFYHEASRRLFTGCDSGALHVTIKNSILFYFIFISRNLLWRMILIK